ncbi:MAG: HupE/UreJ family protein [Myxococcales bacterium]|nr:HupE/UreJ family protein [Myxococcales bacterium]
MRGGRRASGAVAVGVALLSLWAPLARAHNLTPPLLLLEASSDGRVAVTFREPLGGGEVGAGGGLAPVLPACPDAVAATAAVEGDAIVTRRALACAPGAMVGAEVGVDGLRPGSPPVMLLVRASGEELVHTLLDAGASRVTVPPRATLGRVVGAYLGLGATHLLGGWDHLLFVLGLLLVVRGRRILVAVTAFTVGHSVTLALAVLGVVSVPSAPVEIAIAASIAFLGYEAQRALRGHRTAVARHPAWLPAAIGLVHGLGFAGALTEAGLPAEAVPEALVAFNVGLELAQIGVIGAALGLAFAATRGVPALARRAPPALAWGVGAVGVFLTLWRAFPP